MLPHMKTTTASPNQLCFSCGRKFKPGSVVYVVDTRDGQTVDVGPECFRRVMKAGERGYRHPNSHLALYPLESST